MEYLREFTIRSLGSYFEDSSIRFLDLHVLRKDNEGEISLKSAAFRVGVSI